MKAFQFFYLIFLIGFVEGTLIGGRCRYDSDCFVEQSFCHMHEICQCKEGFIVSKDGQYCVATIGAICNSRHDCGTLQNSICNDEQCLCDRGHVPDPDYTVCRPISSGIKGNCDYDSQCQEVLGDFSTCRNRQCECFPHYHYFGSVCIRSVGLGEPCRNSSQCYVHEHKQNITECINGICQCRRGYHQSSYGTCVSNGTSFAMEKVLFLLSTIIISKYFVHEG